MNIRDFFYNSVMPLHDFYIRMEQRGIRVDFDKRRELVKKYKRLDKENDVELFDLCGGRINVNSPKQVTILLYDELKIPRRKDVGEETLQSLILNVLNKSSKSKEKKIVELTLKGRKLKKTISTYILARVDDDGRMRTLVNIVGTESGRTSTSKIKPPTRPSTYGLPFQTLTKHGDIGPDIRSIYIPDEGYVFIEPDLSQAESRVIALLARDERGLEVFRKYDETKEKRYDIHNVTASWMFDCSPEDVDKEHRQFGKHIRHAGERGMTKHRLVLLAAGFGVNMSEWKAQQFLDKFHQHSPNIRGVYFAEIQDCLLNNNMIMVSPHGRRRQFYEKWGDELFKEAYCQLPQCVVSDHLKFAMLRIESQAPWIQFLQESHDSCLTQVPIDRVDEARRIMKSELEVPIDFSSCSLPRGELIIPCETSIGRSNWFEMEKLN